MSPSESLRLMTVEALLNRRVSVLMVLDTGATYTVLTKQTAKDLGIIGLERLPQQYFLTASEVTRYCCP
jgi:predicted aspartyl protease